MKLLRKYAPLVRNTNRFVISALLLIFTAALIFVTSAAVMVEVLGQWPVIVGLGVIVLGLAMIPATALMLLWMRSVESLRQRIDAHDTDIATLDARIPGRKLPM